MSKYLKGYIEHIQSIENFDSDYQKTEVLEELVLKISFFSHERLVHLIVTATFAILTLLSLLLSHLNSTSFSYILIILFLLLLIPYVWHYYILENGVQKLYREYDRIKEL